MSKGKNASKVNAKLRADLARVTDVAQRNERRAIDAEHEITKHLTRISAIEADLAPGIEAERRRIEAIEERFISEREHVHDHYRELHLVMQKMIRRCVEAADKWGKANPSYDGWRNTAGMDAAIEAWPDFANWSVDRREIRRTDAYKLRELQNLQTGEGYDRIKRKGFTRDKRVAAVRARIHAAGVED